jgi:prepilin-type N-terminal cleavage/methylation domain-containing protein
VRRRAGFTLIELVLALVLVAFGLLALSATSALVTREVGSAGLRVAAAFTARNRVEWLVVTPCASLTGGAAEHPHGVREWWTVERNGHSVVLRDSVVIVTPSGARALVLRSARVC